jgi:hypothetical protein
MAWLDDLILLLEDSTLPLDAPTPGFALNTDLFATSKGTVPRLAGSGTVALTETSAGPPERTQNSVIRPGYVHVGAQIRARADTPALAYATARKAYDKLVGIRNVKVGASSGTATFYREINPLQEPQDMNADSHDQTSFVFTIHAIKRYSAGD